MDNNNIHPKMDNFLHVSIVYMVFPQVKISLYPRSASARKIAISNDPTKITKKENN